MTRILLITHFFPPGHIGGTEVLTEGLAQGLIAAGHEVSVICAEDWDTASDYKIYPTDEIYHGIPVRRLHFNWTKAPEVFRYLYNNPEVHRHILDLIDQQKPDILHITSLYSLSPSVISAAAERNVPVVFSATDFWLLCAKNTLLRSDGTLCSGPENVWKCASCLLANTKAYRWPGKVLSEGTMEKLVLSAGRHASLTNRPGLRGLLGDWQDRFAFLASSIQSVDFMTTASQFLRDLFIQYGVPAEKIKYSSYGLDTRWAVQYNPKTPSSKLRIGFIGQIVPFKGPDLLVKAATSLGSDAPFELKIYGDLTKDPAYGQTLRQLAGGDPRIQFLGTFENSRMGEILSGMDVLAVPSTWYDFPLVITSALATKTPVIASNLPGMNEVIQHDINGLLFERFDWNGIRSQIQRLLQDPNLILRLTNGIGSVKTIPEMVSEYVEIYDQLLETGNLDRLDLPGKVVFQPGNSY